MNDVDAPALLPPSVTFRRRRWAAEGLADMAGAWHAVLAASIPPAAEAVAIVMQSHPETIALLFAASALRVPVVLLHADPATWRSAPPFPRVMPVILSPVTAPFDGALRAAGFSTMILLETPGAAGVPRPRFLATPGFVILTSGSTGAPKPTFRSTVGVLQAARAVIRTYGVPHGGHVVGCLALATSFGLIQNIVLPAVLRGHLGLLDRFHHRSLLNLLAAEEFDYWPLTALMADLLARAPLDGWSGRAPGICNVSSAHVPETVYRRFLQRFGVPLRQSYGRSECSFITSETAAPDEIRPDTVGFPTPGVEIRCGASPEQPVPAGSPGRIWIRCPWHSEGYGYPPELEPIARADGWCSTEDLGTLTAEGRLVILGRMDDCFKTTGGFLVSPTLVAGALRTDPGVLDAAVVPVQGRSGTVIGIVAAVRAGVEASHIRALARRVLPSSLRPAVVVLRPMIPCLPSGKHDRAACIALLSADMGHLEEAAV